MEPNGMLPTIASGILGLEMSLHQHPQQQQQQQPQHQHHQQMVSFAKQQQQQQQSPYGYGTSKTKQQQGTPLSDEDEQGLADDRGSGGGGGGDSHSGGGKCVGSPWQRMKWTDNMVRLLIMMVYYVGDDAGGAADADSSGKKKGGAGGGSGGMLQKKGKWKSVSRAMMEKGFYVSPQQCEDKFNDLNKRYKRVNDILGKGTACRVVENQALLDTMDHISSKMKEEVRKLLNSKHLFFREMCAYHSSGAGAAAAAAVAGAPHPDMDSMPQHQQRCLHSVDNSAVARRERMREEEEGKEIEEDDDEEDDSDEDDDDEDEEIEGGGIEQRNGHGDEKGLQFSAMSSSSKRQRLSPPSVVQQLGMEVMGVLGDGTKSQWEQRQWLQSHVVLLEEKRLVYQRKALELEKQRFKWLKFSGKKEREMEKMKLENERAKLENERMVLLLRQKELELDMNHAKRSDLSSCNG